MSRREQAVPDVHLGWYVRDNTRGQTCLSRYAAKLTLTTPGLVSRSATGPQSGYSWIVRLLPFMEQGNIYNNLSNASKKFAYPAFQLTGGSPPARARPRASARVTTPAALGQALVASSVDDRPGRSPLPELRRRIG